MTLHGHDWLINGDQHHRSEPVKAGELQVWDIVNETGMDHPFHLHGFFFQVIAVNGERVRPTSWPSTANAFGRRHGKTPSTWSRSRLSQSRSAPTTVPASKCITATSSSITRRA
jgi:FtsP/CotA-like multicopper oxidase with cupredoxin domain